jgi:hypothetical protein
MSPADRARAEREQQQLPPHVDAPSVLDAIAVLISCGDTLERAA